MEQDHDTIINGGISFLVNQSSVDLRKSPEQLSSFFSVNFLDRVFLNSTRWKVTLQLDGRDARLHRQIRSGRHLSTFTVSLQQDALPFDAAPFQSKTRHEFNIAAVYLH